MTRLMLQMMTSTIPEVRTTFHQMERTNTELFHRLLSGVAPEQLPNVSFGLDAALASALTGLLTGSLSLDDSVTRVEWVARAVLTRDAPADPV